MSSQVPRDPNLSQEMRRFLDEKARGVDSAQATASAAVPASTFAAWTSYVPTITAGTGTFTSVSATGRYITIGKLTFISITVTITTNGTAATDVIATLPNTAGAAAGLHGRENGVSGKTLTGAVLSGASNVLIINYDNTYPGQNGAVLVVSGIYENA